MQFVHARTNKAPSIPQARQISECGCYPYNQDADTVGDGSGTTNFIANHAATIAKVAPPVGVAYAIERLLFTLEDAGNFTTVLYGALPALTTGITLRVVNDSGTLYNLTTQPIKTNGNWGSTCYDANISAWGGGNAALHVRWTFSKGGSPVFLYGDEGGELQVVLDDDFTGLVTHRFHFQGVRQPV
jgi:hypothetical protein